MTPDRGSCLISGARGVCPTRGRWAARFLLLLLPLLVSQAPLVWAQGSGTFGGEDGQDASAGESTFEWRAIFKLIAVTSHAEPWEAGYAGVGDDTAQGHEQNLRLQLTGSVRGWLDYRLDYLNVKQDLSGPASPDPALGAALFRRWRLSEVFEAPASKGSTQSVRWYHEIDHAFVRLDLGAVEAVLGRQPITWGAGRFWQPTELFAAFSPFALDTEFKPGVDGALFTWFAGEYSKVEVAYVLSGGAGPRPDDSAVLRWRGSVGEESEATLLAGSLREEPVAGGSFESTVRDAGWRVEALTFRPRGTTEREVFATAGLDTQLSTGTLVLAEVYHHTLGAGSEADLLPVLTAGPVLEGRVPHLSRTVLGLSLSDSLSGLWSWGYGAFAAALRDSAGKRRPSALHTLTFNYSISDEAAAVFSFSGGSGPGLADPANPLSLRSDFGHMPDSFYVALQFVL